MFVTNWISTTKIQKYRRLPTFLGTISYPELRYTFTRKGLMKENIHETFLYMYIMKLLQLYTCQDLISSASQMSHEGASLIASLFQEGLIIHQRTHQT